MGVRWEARRGKLSMGPRDMGVGIRVGMGVGLMSVGGDFRMGFGLFRMGRLPFEFPRRHHN